MNRNFGHCVTSHMRLVSPVRRLQRPRGFVTIIAIAMIFVVAATLITMMARVGSEAAGHLSVSYQAQLRQLLQAGGVAAWSLLPDQNPQSNTLNLSLPDSLTKHGAKVTLESLLSPSKLRMSVNIVAELGGKKIRQRIIFVNDNKRWGPVSADLVLSASKP